MSIETRAPPWADRQDQAYEALNDYLTQHQDEVIDISVLPPGIPFDPDRLILHEGSILGVPKTVLVSAFLQAKRMFEQNQALETTRIILLFDPEYLTAANFRKRKVLEQKEGKSCAGLEGFKQVLDRETAFLNSILTSPLFRQSKSPTLWHHRSWLLDLSLPIHITEDSPEAVLSFTRAELDAVLKAGEQHPKNYYAWQYARTLFNKLGSMFVDEAKHSWKSSYHAFLTTSALLVKAWCCKHVSDTSGLSFLLFLLPSLDSIARRRRIVKDILEYTVKLQLEQESLWTFLRTALADTLLEAERDPLIQQLSKYQSEMIIKQRTGDDQPRVTDALKWIEIYKKLLQWPSPEDRETKEK
ncbi:hypothetical protein BCR34DRAFT_484567 [Clohesyomyces aquaticus]|uniref:Protein prenylyltransferase n=1 Tax=Clohesyomyces aquaticus TaxID=1231657 RepID=A0A1Y1ZLQ3_9PLEO|nr:hypothetical protein BCR34DRAFT_484567 [Clohesyomyces aquaticus]